VDELSILRRSQVEKLTGRSYSSIRRDIARGAFPKPVQIGPRAIGWRSHEVRAWLDSRTVAALPPAIAKPPASKALG